jgi:Pyridoxamine 5'-phosphate oxidase
VREDDVMARWSDVQQAAPHLARRAENRFKAHRHALLATLRKDGRPRVTGVETQFVLGDLWMGMMGGSRKARDLLRDPRMALHATLDAPEVETGDARISGRAEAVVDDERIAAWSATLDGPPPGPFHLFRVDVAEVTLVRAVVDHLVIESWTDEHGFRTFERR